ncbi:MAG: arylsulfatase A-like enzyme [Chlamydiales bacterium]|jgi:arylsulfatase A-like enzyme
MEMDERPERAGFPASQTVRDVAARAVPWIVLTALCCGCRPGDSDEVRRVILITCDTLRADRLGCYGSPGATSPYLDRFAADAIVFDEAYAQAPITRPSLSSLMTGRMPREIGTIPENIGILGPEARTLAEILGEHGIQTAAVVSNGILQGGTMTVGLGQGFDVYDDSMPTREQNRELFERVASGTSDAAIDWLSEQAQDPFFLWVHYQDPHGPYNPPLADMGPEAQPAADLQETLPDGHSESGRSQIPNYQQIAGLDSTALYRARYEGEIRYFDRELGRLFDFLRERELFDDALVIVSADHGESLGEHGFWFCHGENLDRAVVRIPLIVRSPRAPGVNTTRNPQLPGRRCTEPIALLDLFPTILEAFGLPKVRSRGLSLFEPRRPVQRVIPQNLFRRGEPEWRAATDGRYRLVWAVDGSSRALYDTQQDPGEKTDLLSGLPEVAGRLRAGYRNFHAAPFEPIRGLKPDEARRAILESLGYAGGDAHD